MTKFRTTLPFRPIVCLALLAALTPVARAQDNKLPRIEQVRVGLPFGQGDPESGRARHGAWAPVYVKLKAGSQPIANDSLRLVVESSDGEDAPYQYTTPLPFVEAEKDYFAITYARPGSYEINVSLETAEGKRASFLVTTPDGKTAVGSRLAREFSREDLGSAHTLYLALGSRLPGLARTINAAIAEAQDENAREDRSLRKLTFLDSVEELPDRWYGYDAVDILVLTTANDSFVKALLDPAAAPRRRALGEWVRRGGKLVVSVGRNRQLVAELLEQLPLSEFDKQPLINCKIDGAVTTKGPKGLSSMPLRVLTRWATAGRESPEVLEIAELTHLRPNLPESGAKTEPVNALIREAPSDEDKVGPPVIVHAACGMGRVLLIGFDLELEPFSTWAGQKTVWEKVETELDPRNASVRREAQFMGRGMAEEMGGDLKRSLESFKEVPVISFGWVALFILVYIVIVGPLDYFLLKKVFKRLELTWITFPTVVLAISVAAYFTAYALKGDDLRINKIDVYDLDLHGPTPQAYGSTWVTLFSPRIQNYTIGIDPTGPASARSSGTAWVAASSSDTRTPRSVVTVMEGDDSAVGRLGSQSLFRRAYDYAPDASGLENVSIPVWSMRTFSARWRAPATSGQVGIDADFHHSRDKNDPGLLGRITNHLPVELRDVTLLYHGKSYAAEAIPPEGFLAIDNLKVGERGKPMTQWLSDPSSLSPHSDRTVTGQQLMRDLLFHTPPAQVSKPNGGWRALDQAWRLRPLVEFSSGAQPQSVYRDEVLLVARVPSLAEASESAMRADAAPTRLWLDSLPGSGAQRPSLSGFIVQDVYVRVYIPVNP